MDSPLASATATDTLSPFLGFLAWITFRFAESRPWKATKFSMHAGFSLLIELMVDLPQLRAECASPMALSPKVLIAEDHDPLVLCVVL
jgi:hypothetical protein